MILSIDCPSCGKKHYGQHFETCRECTMKATRAKEKPCAWCGVGIPWKTENGRYKSPNEYARRGFCSNRCARKAYQHGQRKPEPVKAHIEQPKHSGRKAFASESQALVFIDWLISKGYKFMNRPGAKPKFSDNTGFYGVEYTRSRDKGSVFFITTREQVFIRYFNSENRSE